MSRCMMVFIVVGLVFASLGYSARRCESWVNAEGNQLNACEWRAPMGVGAVVLGWWASPVGGEG